MTDRHLCSLGGGSSWGRAGTPPNTRDFGQAGSPRPLTFTQRFLVPPALRVPQHVLRGFVDVPQGEFAEELAPAGQGDRCARIPTCAL